MTRLILLTMLLAAGSEAPKDSPRWAGVDETVVERFAAEAGRKPREPLLPIDQGDLPLFLFLTAGAVGGFIAGYSFRALFPPKSRCKEPHAPTG